VTALGELCVGLLWTQVKERRPLGPPDAILFAQIMSGKIPIKSSLFSSIGSVICLGCGASVGQYGPLVLMGSATGSLLGVQSAKKMGIVGIGCGAAAAIATAMNAPIAGLVFAHEVILRHYSIRAFAPVTVAATVGYVMANFVFKQQSLFHINPDSLQHPLEYLGFESRLH
jgi:CIC family chloride channel protein